MRNKTGTACESAFQIQKSALRVLTKESYHYLAKSSPQGIDQLIPEGNANAPEGTKFHQIFQNRSSPG